VEHFILVTVKVILSAVLSDAMLEVYYIAAVYGRKLTLACVRITHQSKYTVCK